MTEYTFSEISKEPDKNERLHAASFGSCSWSLSALLFCGNRGPSEESSLSRLHLRPFAWARDSLDRFQDVQLRTSQDGRSSKAPFLLRSLAGRWMNFIPVLPQSVQHDLGNDLRSSRALFEEQSRCLLRGCGLCLCLCCRLPPHSFPPCLACLACRATAGGLFRALQQEVNFWKQAPHSISGLKASFIARGRLNYPLATSGG
mmetsp:Transcript_6454/g.13977  ORF Transcript_6454/g.13977 Transcript_6454/m.13977 type:complete len:202 (+) Transcript_6454:66-671(+)